MRSLTRFALAAMAAVVPGTAHAQLEVVEVHLFMPCNQETADRAIAALGAFDGVADVDAVVGSLVIRAMTTEHYSADALALVQLLWDNKIFPRRIYLVANADASTVDTGMLLSVRGQDQRFDVANPEALAGVEGDGPLRLEVLDWIEDRTLAGNERYTVRIVTPAATVGGPRP